MARIKIEDLPVGRPRTAEEMEEILGAGRRTVLSIEALEERAMMSTTAIRLPTYLDQSQAGQLTQQSP